MGGDEKKKEGGKAANPIAGAMKPYTSQDPTGLSGMALGLIPAIPGFKNLVNLQEVQA